MKTYWIDVGCEARVRHGHDREDTIGDLESHFLQVMDALQDEPGAIDPDITATLTTGRIVISMGIEAKTDRAALDQAILIVRSAIHKAGGFTPDWAELDGQEFVVTDGFDARVRPADLASC